MYYDKETGGWQVLREGTLEEISDGRLYELNDMVRADCAGCQGCSKCCRSDMGTSITLDPYDVWLLTRGTGRSFESMVEKEIRLSVLDGLILPHMNMEHGCGFLDQDGRCTIHPYRPSICRLFPLGRQYDGPKTSYFIVEGGCVNGRLSKVRIDRWIGIPDLADHERFKGKWRSLLRTLKARLAAEPSEEVQRSINLYFLRTFYMTPYESVYEPTGEQTGGPSCEPTGGSAKAFYAELDRRISEFEKAVL